MTATVIPLYSDTQQAIAVERISRMKLVQALEASIALTELAFRAAAQMDRLTATEFGIVPDSASTPEGSAL